jgi:hypothetical protein
LTSVVGAVTYSLLAMTSSGSIAPVWSSVWPVVWVAWSAAFWGAHLQPRLPENALRLLLGGLPFSAACIYRSCVHLRSLSNCSEARELWCSTFAQGNTGKVGKPATDLLGLPVVRDGCCGRPAA